MSEFDPRLLTAELNEAQREAVTAPPSHRLVLAGAGSGKTRVLTHRIAWLVAAEDVSPHSILAVTFTNKAAAEMRGRIEALLDIPVRSLWVGTFHGIAHRMLRLHWKDAGLVQNFQILDADDQVRQVKRVLRGLDMPEDRWPPKTVAGWINKQKEDALRPEDFSDSGDIAQRALVRAYSAYQRTCDDNGLVDFAELLLRAFELLRDNADLRAHYHQRFRHILVDEFQDTNTLQYRWLRLVAGEQGIVFCVGDDDQSVYSWRGAKVENMTKLQRDYFDLEVIRLEQNYRSTSVILNAANTLIAHNAERMGKNLWTDAGEGELIQVYTAFNDLDEADFVVGRIAAESAKGRAYTEMAILYRTSAQSRVLEERLVQQRIPYRIYGGLRFFERMEIRDTLAWMRLLSNRDDDTAFERALGTPPRGVGATSLEKLRAAARDAGTSLWAASSQAESVIGRTAGKLRAFCQLIEQLAGESRSTPLSKMIERVIDVAGLREHYRKEKGEAGQARLDNLDELISAAKAFEGDDVVLEDLDPLTAFLTHAALEAGEQQAGEGSDCVHLMTLHAAKGLEFPLVFLVGVEEGLFPHQRAVNEGSLEEERRLCYVGITRAREQLYITHAEARRTHGVENLCAPSRFLRELPSEGMHELRPRAGVVRPRLAGRFADSYASSAPSRPLISDAPPPQTGLYLGARVRHARFGEGTVTAFDGEGERARVEVAFADSGSKWLIASMARLEPL
ncbi:DNA helicase II [Algiphilus sp.]|uniref:DNA helicase II n=1 Tax=Algiphilus sp. TaxID=1872431 RepID=UPI003BAA2A30